MTRVLVCGGRHFDNDEAVFNVLNNYDHDRDFSLVIQGGAKGADSAAKRWAEGNTPVMTFAANWKKHGKAAGPIRNETMLREGKPDLVIAFPGGRGTANMVQLAKLACVEVVEISVSEQAPTPRHADEVE